ncbi:hypothetical protein [Fictibacillus terranigra]|uniref:Uncharacterized protein n=1 Tax=Fictibacillus terranigra TaxID=3058424 RepID=A0ABT8E2C4_9BACL|nr:hypothetical protein [Fictibacillus sp. CENA-BCM004]MDN4072062.1 hypothetical protein [Fictibacillus sp. CENA-BCM004]
MKIDEKKLYLLLLQRMEEALGRLDRYQAKLDIIESNFNKLERGMDNYHYAILERFEQMEHYISYLEHEIEVLQRHVPAHEEILPLQ